MRWIFKVLIFLITAFAKIMPVSAVDLRPTQFLCQSGGGMGAVSIGTGWRYGSHLRWETNVFIGIVPKYESASAKVSLALKENFIPWRIGLNDRFTLEPFTASIYFTTLISNQVWSQLPERYSSGYYILPTKIRANISFGQRLKYSLSGKSSILDSISAYYEIGTCDIYLLSAAGNHEIKFHEFLQLCIGLSINI